MARKGRWLSRSRQERCEKGPSKFARSYSVHQLRVGYIDLYIRIMEKKMGTTI